MASGLQGEGSGWVLMACFFEASVEGVVHSMIGIADSEVVCTVVAADQPGI